MKEKRPRKGARLGQHFLKAPWAAHALVNAVKITPTEPVVEIGPGKGALTKELLAAGGNVIAIEKDEGLVSLLQETFGEQIEKGRLKILSSDIRDFEPSQAGLTAGGYCVAANIPYYITGEIIRQFLSTATQPRSLALLIQKEVAQRITSKKESILSLSVKAYGVPKIVEKVPRRFFSPPPSVDSAILLVDTISKTFFKDISEESFFAVVHAGFSSKRKFLANNLGNVFGKEKVLAAFSEIGLSEKSRAENVALEEWGRLTALLS